VMTKLHFQLAIWRQASATESGKLVNYEIDDISPDMSFLELLDVLNERLTATGEEPIQFDSDCREGICGTCCLTIDGVPHGGQGSTCQLYMRQFTDGAKITIEPFRARAFPVIKDLTIDRSAFDRIIAAGGYVATDPDNIPDANAIVIPQAAAEQSFDLATCIGCGACVAACPNAAAALFVGANVARYTYLPQGQPERKLRVRQMVAAMDAEDFGNCSNHGQCANICPQAIPLSAISTLRHEYFNPHSALLLNRYIFHKNSSVEPKEDECE
jgi:succinate dehydrogenase / fumarate reductase, iron-sulfur subunit